MNSFFSDLYYSLGFMGFPAMGQVIINTILGIAAFFVAFALNSNQFRNGWFLTLRIILGIVSVSSFGTVVSSVSVGWIPGNPNDALLLCSLGALCVWGISYYLVHLSCMEKGRKKELISLLKPRPLEDKP